MLLTDIFRCSKIYESWFALNTRLSMNYFSVSRGMSAKDSEVLLRISGKKNEGWNRLETRRDERRTIVVRGIGSWEASFMDSWDRLLNRFYWLKKIWGFFASIDSKISSTLSKSDTDAILSIDA